MIATQYVVMSKSEMLMSACGGAAAHIRFAVSLTELGSNDQATINFVSDNPNALARYKVGSVVDVNISPSCE